MEETGELVELKEYHGGIGVKGLWIDSIIGKESGIQLAEQILIQRDRLRLGRQSMLKEFWMDGFQSVVPYLFYHVVL